MKKLLSIALVLVLSLSLSVTVFAAEIKPGDNGEPDPDHVDTPVQFSVAPAYTVTIPESVALSREVAEDDTVTYEQVAEVIAEDVRLLNNQVIEVTLRAGDGGFVLTTEQNATLSYTVTVDDETIESGDVVATFDTSTAKQIVELHFVAEDPTYAGTYKDTVVFDISVK